MPGSIVCNVCGGKDFYNEAGFYFCNECQTQTQEIREQVFDQQDNTAHLRITKTTVRQDKSFSQVRLTSWEIFNHILYGLVEELNTLGVNKDFKEVCYHLWINYLTKLEIMSVVPDGLPKLNACFRARDAEIIFNRSTARKRKKRPATTPSSIVSSGNSSSNDLDAKMHNKERMKQRRKMIRAEYDDYSNTKSSETTSIHNQTLSSLGSDDESVSSSGGQLVFTKAARKELLKVMSRDHLQLHINDTQNEMKCHKFSRKLFQKSSNNEVGIITRNKLYSIIYLALRLTQDSFQLGDIIRFCREGHLSYMEYKHFFPDILSDNCIDESVYNHGMKSLLQSELVRTQAWDIYHLLELKKVDLSPDLIELCKRYCTELNLPDEVFNISADFIKNTKPEFKTTGKTKGFPNHEGRVMAFIIYTLKVLFGFDGATEHEYTSFAQMINKKDKQSNNRMFVFDDWFNYIQYRKLVLKKTYFPIKFLYEPNGRDTIDLYLKFMKERKILYDSDEAATLSMKIARKYLSDLEIEQDNLIDDRIDFKPTVTPFRSYIDLLQTIHNFNVDNIPINREILRDRSKDTIHYILHHSEYLKSIKSTKCQTIRSGKNTKHEFHKIRKVNWEIMDIHVRNWHKSFHKDKMEALHFEELLDKILHKQKENIVKPSVVMCDRLNKSEPIINFVEINKNINKQNLGRNSQGRFCKKDSEENVGVDNFQPKKTSKWFVSPWYDNPNLSQHQYNPSLAYQVVKDVERKVINNDSLLLNGPKSKNAKYPAHYCPWFEYWINVKDMTSQTPAEKWEAFNATLPKNFQWLLRECATIIEQKPLELFVEFINVEVYMCYLYLGNVPVLYKYCDNYKSITKLIQKVKNTW